MIKLNHTKLNLERIVFIGRAHVNLNGNRPAYLDKIMNMLKETGTAAEEIKTNYEFQKNANTMLVLRKNKALESQLL